MKHDRARSDRIVASISSFTETYGHPPSVRQIQERVGLASPSTVHYYLARLIEQGIAVPCDCGCGRVHIERTCDNSPVGSSDESNRIATVARVSATTRDAGDVASIEVVAR